MKSYYFKHQFYYNGDPFKVDTTANGYYHSVEINSSRCILRDNNETCLMIRGKLMDDNCKFIEYLDIEPEILDIYDRLERVFRCQLYENL